MFWQKEKIQKKYDCAVVVGFFNIHADTSKASTTKVLSCILDNDELKT